MAKGHGRSGAALRSEIGKEIVAEAVVAAAGFALSQAARPDSALRRRMRRARLEPRAVLRALAAGADAFAEAMRRGPPERA